jgi:hypothetical protein
MRLEQRRHQRADDLLTLGAKALTEEAGARADGRRLEVGLGLHDGL